MKQPLKHIMLIEPDQVQAEAIGRSLMSPTTSIEMVTSAQTAIAAADKQLPDAVILELALPSHNGIEFLHEFRSYPEWASVPVIVFSQQQVADESAFKALGNVTILYKPQTSLAELNERLQNLLA